MLSKNNYHEKLRKMEPRKERFSIRKFSIGAASVLIGFSFMSMAGNQKVQAATEKNPVVVTQNAEQQSKTDGAQSAANAQNNKAADAEKVNTTNTSNQNATDSKVTQSSAQDSSKVNATSDSKNASDSTNEVKQNNQATQPETSTASKEGKNNEAAKDASANQTTNKLNINKVSETQAKAGSEAVTPTNKEMISENKAKVESTNNTQPKAAMLSLAQESNSATQVETVTDYSAFLNALRNANTGTINLQNDIDFSNVNLKHGPNNGLSGTYERLNNTGIARAVTINGNGHELKMGDRYIEFTSANQENTDSNWDIQLKDLTLQTTSGYGPFWFANTPDEAAKNTITFNGVTTTTDSHEIMWYNAGGASTTHVKFEGNNTINSTLNGNTAAIYAYSIEAVNGNTTFNVIDSSPDNAGANRSAILISIDAAHAGKVIVDKGATLTINGDNQVNVPEMNSADSYGTMGIRFQNWAKTDLDKAKTSVVQVNGNLNLNMGKGGSTAILGSYVDVQPDGNVTINTQQNGTSTAAGDLALGHKGTHFGVIAGGIEASDDYAGLRIANGGSLKIIRPTDVNSTQPLISYGDALASGGKTFTVNVESGGTLDLQDGATDPQTWSFSNTSSTGKTNMPWAGLITMWGTSGTNTIKINNPKYINLQRTGNQTGSLMRLEGTTNNVSINGDINNAITPLAQWDEGAKNNPSYYWYIENEANQNNWGNYANRFVQNGKNPQPAANAGATTFMHSSGSVQMAPNQAGTNSSKFSNGEVAQTLNEAINYQAPYLNQFLNHFSWWAPQRIAMGSGLEDVVKPTDAEKYQPVVQTIDGNTNQTLNDLTAKDGIKGLLSSDGTETTDLSSIKSVSWYDASTDATDWKSVMGDEAEPTNPTGDLKTTDKSAWAKVTYTDGSVDFANIPLNITEPMANLYTPSYKPVTVEQDQSATDDPAFTDQDGKDTTAPTGTTFTTGTDTPNWATIDPSTGTVTVKPGTDVTPGAYNVPVTVTYPDKSTDETTVPVIVTKAGQTVTWGDNGAVVTTIDTSKLNAHETTDNSQVLSAAGVVTAEGYELTDGKLSTTATPITIDPSTVSWTTTPDTNVDTATASGKEITTSVNVDFTNNDAAKNILGSKNGVVTTNPFTIDAKGAGAKSVTAPVDIKLGSDLTSEQFGQLVDNNIPTDEIAKTEWATKPNEKGQGGVIKITFTDNDANGNPTYLNINIPASSIKVTTDADDHNPEGQDVSTKVGEVPDAEKGIKNPGSLPSGTTYTWQDTPDTTKPGKKPAVVVVTYPDGSTDNVPTNVIVDAKPEIKTITTTVGGDPAATEGIANLNKGGTTPVDGYPTSATWTTKPDTSKPGATTGTATVTYPDGTTETVTIPVAVNGQGDVTVIDNGHVFSLHANDVITHKTSDKNIIGEPVIENFKLSYYQGGQSYSKPYIYTLNADKTAYVLTQTGDNPAGVTVTAPQSINASDIKISWTEADTVLFNNALGAIKGNGQPTSLASANNGGTKTITYTNWVNNQFGYPKYSAVVNSSSVNWPIYGKGPVSTYPFPSVYIYGAEANGTIPSVNSDTTDLKAALGDASKLVNTSDLTAAHNAEISSIDWQTLPSLETANAKAPATVRINFTDGSYLDVPVSVNVIKVDQGVDDKTDHDIYRDITRTINVEGESTPVVQHVIYSRARITDLSKPADQQTSYTDWAAAKNSEGQVVTNFPQYEVTKPGYTATAIGATIETVDGKQYVPASGTITENSNDETVNVTYTANEHTLVINYVDGNGTVVGTYNVPGKTDETVNVDVPGNVPTNWKLVPNQQVMGSYKFGSDDPQPVDYKVEHGTENVPVDKNNKDTYRKITQTIQEVPAGKTNADMTVVRMASFEFERTGVKDLVTGKTTWNAWNSNSETFPVYNIKEQKGYDSYVNGVKASEVAAVTVNPDSSNITDTITYVKQAATPVPYDPSNKDMNKSVTRTINYEVPAGHEAIAPVTQTVEYTRDVNGVAGYQDPVTGEITWNPWHVKSGKAEFASASVEQIKGYDSYVDGIKASEVAAAAVTEKDGEPQNGATVTVSYQKQGNIPVKWDGTKDNMTMKVTRTINYQVPEGQATIAPVTQTVEYTREDAQGNAGYTDPATGITTWNAWHVADNGSAEFPITQVEQIKGYDSYVDGTKATEVAAAAVTEKDGVPQNGANVTVSYQKQADTVVPYDPSNKDMNMSVNRTINYEVPAGHEAIAPVTQTVEYTRDVNGVAGCQDPVTGHITWNAWHVKSGKAEFASASVEQIKGYDSYVDGTKASEVAAAAVTEKDGEPQNGATVTVTYKKSGSETPTVENFKQSIVYQDKDGNVISTANDAITGTFTSETPATVSADELKTKINANVPANWKIAASYTYPATETIKTKTVANIVVLVEHGTKDITPNDPSVNPTDPKYKDMFTTVSRDIYQTKPGETETKFDTQYVHFGRNGVEDLVTGVVTGTGDWKVGKIENNRFVEVGKAEFASENAPQIKGYDSYVDGIKSTEVPAASALKDGQPVDGASVHITYVKEDSTPVPYKPGQEGVNDDMNQYVTRTIVVHEPGQDPVSHYQTVHFTNKDKDGNSGYIDPVTGKTIYNTVWHLAGDINQANGTWAEFNAPTVKGYTPSQAKVAAEEVTAETKDVTVDINYAPVAPTGQNVTTKVGKVPDADQGIANKGDLPDGTKYTWKTTPDVTTEGNKPAVVVVTYPGGSTVEVPVTVTVTKNPTDADKYTPEGQDVNTKTGVVPDPAEGIKNKSDLPDGTKYTWKDTPDVTTAGDKPATVVVTYPDGSKDEVPVIIHVTNPTTPTDADKYTPEGQDVNTKTGVVPDPAEGIKNKSDLPDGTKYTWKDTPDVTTAGDKPATVVVTYPDGSKDEVPVTIHVTNPTTPTDADKYTPEGQDVNTKTGVVPDPAEGIKNKGDLPDGTKYTWKDTPDVTTEGNKPAVVVVTYPDGSKDEVPVTIHVTNPTTDADKYTPEGQDVNTKTGVVPDPAEGIKNKSDLPDGTKYTWKDTPDVTTEGNKPAVVVVTYPDGSKDEVPVTIHVTNPTTPTDADKYTPEGQDVNTKTGVVPDPAEGIKNKSDLPDGTKYTWKDTPDVTTAGDKPATVVVTYPDGSKDEVPVTIHVTNPTTDADKYTPEGQDVNTKTGVVPNPADGIKNKSDLPDGTKYTWEKTPDITKPGESTGVIVVTYPDGSKDEVPVTIHVTNPTTDADKYTPEGQDVNTKTGVVPNPAEGIKNKSDLPDGTKYTWEKTPDVTKPGESTGVIVVTYPDGSKDEVPVTIHVTNPTTDADKYTPEGQDVNTKTGVVPNPAEGIKNKSDLPDGTKYTWEKTPDVTKPGESTGVIVVTYPDGSKDEVTVKVIVNTNNVTPETQPIHTTPGVLPNPADAIKNKDEMPAGTKYTWKEVPNVNTVGEHTGVITVTYPDGSSVDLTVKVYVDAVATENNSNNTAQVITKHVTETNEKKTSATPAQQIKHSEKATLPQTGAKSENTAGILGLAIAAVGSLFGLGAGKKRRDK